MIGTTARCMDTLHRRKTLRFHNGMFHGFDFDGTMLRIGSMNMLLHGIETPDARYKDTLFNPTEGRGDEEPYSLVLANPLGSARESRKPFRWSAHGRAHSRRLVSREAARLVFVIQHHDAIIGLGRGHRNRLSTTLRA